MRDVSASLLFANILESEHLISAATKLHASLAIANTIFYAHVGVIAGLHITSIITKLTDAASSYNLSNDVSNIDFNNRVSNHFELDLKSELRKVFISKPIVLRRTRTTCEGASSVASIAKCFEGALEPYNLMKLDGYQPFDTSLVSVISSCSTLAPFRQGTSL